MANITLLANRTFRDLNSNTHGITGTERREAGEGSAAQSTAVKE